MPSTGIVSPARTSTRSPRRTWLAGTDAGPSHRADPLGRRRRKIQQRPDRPPRVVQAQCLQRLGEPVQEGHGRRLIPLSQRHRPQDRQSHQHVDIEAQPQQVPRRPGKDADSAHHHGQRIRRQRQAVGSASETGRRVPRQENASPRASASPEPPVRTHRSTATTTSERTAPLAPCTVACIPVRSAISRLSSSGSTTPVVIVDRHRPMDQVEPQADDPLLVAQRRRSAVDFLGTVKAPNLKRATGLAHPNTLSSIPFELFRCDRRSIPSRRREVARPVGSRVSRWRKIPRSCLSMPIISEISGCVNTIIVDSRSCETSTACFHRFTPHEGARLSAMSSGAARPAAKRDQEGSCARPPIRF